MKTRFISWCLAALTLLVAGAAHAEDIDLFTGTSSNTGTAPNLLIIIDNAANFSSSAGSGNACTIAGTGNSLGNTTGGIEQCALYNVVSSVATGTTATVNVGIVMMNASNVVDYQGTACQAGGVGGCVVYPLTPMTLANKTALQTWIANWKTTNGGAGSSWVKASSEATGAVMQEAWAYYAGRTGLSGKNYANVTRPTTSCKNFILFIGNAFDTNGTPKDQTGDSGPKNALIGTNSTANMNVYPVATPAQQAVIVNSSADSSTLCGTVNFPSNHENTGYYADEWARYVNAGSGLNITVYTIGLLQLSSCKPDYPWLMNSMASYGGGKYFPTTSYSTFSTALQTVFSEVRSVNSVFAAVSLPVSVNTQGTYLNQVYIGMFRPDPDAAPRWLGNLKQYKMGYVNGVFQMIDQDGAAAISSSGSEFVAECARSYWTPAKTVAGDGYWSTYTTVNCTGYPATSNSPDGNIVEKGGQGYTLRGGAPSSRSIYTCSSTLTSCTSLTSFSTSNTALTEAAMGLASGSTTPTLANLINWSRGQNTQGEEGVLSGSSITTSSMRPSVHGDIVHSRPAALNFGTDAAPKIVVYYGGNEGIFRAINGNRTDAFTMNSTSIAPGGEGWAFVPPQFLGNFVRLYNDTTPISSANPKNYALDGPVTAFKDATLTSGDGWIFAGLRRGGRTLYAFKTDKTTLATTLKWAIGCGDYTTSNCSSTNFSTTYKIGQTWAPPQVFTAAGYSSGSKPLIIMGGGYDATCEDTVSYSSCASPIGNAIYVLDANDGSLQKGFTTTRGVVGDVTIVTDTNGYASYIYGADLAGNVYRISGPLSGGAYTPIGTNSPGSWVITQIASLGCATITTCTSPPNRKFMFAPDVIVDSGNYYVVLGSGDREKPTNLSNATQNYFFVIKDRPDQGSAYLTDTTHCGAGTTTLCLPSLKLLAKGDVLSTADLAAYKGWALTLDANEQVVTAALTIYGTIYFTTHTPQATASTSCTVNLGKLRNYGVGYTTASGSNSPIVRLDGGLAPDPVAGKVTLDDGTTVPFCIGCTSPLQASQPPNPNSTSNPAKIRAYWFIKK